MSRTTRRHEAPAKAKKRGPTNHLEEDRLKPRLKSHKQKRPNERARLRKEFL